MLDKAIFVDFNDTLFDQISLKFRKDTSEFLTGLSLITPNLFVLSLDDNPQRIKSQIEPYKHYFKDLIIESNVEYMKLKVPLFKKAVLADNCTPGSNSWNKKFHALRKIVLPNYTYMPSVEKMEILQFLCDKMFVHIQKRTLTGYIDEISRKLADA
jgi:hypothetical protein